MKKFFLEGAFCVDTRNERHTRILDVKVRKWFDTMDEITALKKTIDDKINPRNLSFDDATKEMLTSGRRLDAREFPTCEYNRL